tara:strand:- start:237 stop:863 length:627 start_codon:yes stop_codon:yes gene_type:complete
MSRFKGSGLEVKMRGRLLGFELDTNDLISSSDRLRVVMRSAKGSFVKDMNRILRAKVKDRIPALREKLQEGYKGGYIGGKVLKAMGTKDFEMKEQGSHTRHKDIPDIWSRLVSKKGMNIKILGTGSKVTVKTSFKDSRRRDVMFYDIEQGKVPRMSTVATKLDATCLPFIQNGMFADILDSWGLTTTISFQYGVIRYFENREKALKGT